MTPANFLAFAMTPEAEINEMFDSGMFNSIVRGCVHEVLNRLGLEENKQDADIQLTEIFDTMIAADLRKVK